jgi:hypothetical protein
VISANIEGDEDLLTFQFLIPAGKQGRGNV